MVVEIDLTGRTAVVTGASSGIGAETARVLASCGARVLATGRDTSRLAETVDAIEADGGHAVAVAADLAAADGVTRIAEAAAEFGEQVDILALPAGHFDVCTFADTTASMLDQMWAVHVRAPFRLTQALLPRLSDGASVLFYSSTVAQVGFAPYAAYSAAKGAVEGLARSLAIELAPRVRVNIIVPGFTATTMLTDQYDAAPDLEAAIVARTPVGFVDGPKTAAHLAAYLASDLGRYVAGTRVVADGGWVAQGWQAG
jgi:NAD(P)-dependent dehydrogenase (short-subunit alcohol dehydrogenase family)